MAGYTRVVGNADTKENALDVAVSGDYAYLATGSGGLVVLPTQCEAVMGVAEPGLDIGGLGSLRVVPNPSSYGTSIQWRSSRGRMTVAAIYDVCGREVRTLLNGLTEAGSQDLVWDGRDNTGHRVASGVYWVRVRSAKEARVERVVLLR